MIHIFIQARVDSTRFQNKILKKISNKTILELILERARKIETVDDIILVTGSEGKNKPLIEESKKLKLKFFCGSDQNLLDRTYKAGLKFNSDNIIRLTGDNPLIDYSIINRAMKIFSQNEFDILSVNRVPTLPFGMNFEIFRFQSLETVWNDIFNKFPNKDEFFKTFVSPVYNLLYEPKFKNYDFTIENDYSDYRLTIDYEEDFVLISKIIENLSYKGDFLLNDIINLLTNNPHLLKINEKYSKKG